jgi:hypothetical protein
MENREMENEGLFGRLSFFHFSFSREPVLGMRLELVVHSDYKIIASFEGIARSGESREEGEGRREKGEGGKARDPRPGTRDPGQDELRARQGEGG